MSLNVSSSIGGGHAADSPHFVSAGIPSSAGTGRTPSFSKSSAAARYLLESMSVTEAELDGAFLEAMSRLKRHDPLRYQGLAQQARRDPRFRLLLRRTLLDAIIAIQLSSMIEDSALFEYTLENMNVRCRHHDAMAVVEVVLLMFANSENEDRLGFIMAIMSPDSVI